VFRRSASAGKLEPKIEQYKLERVSVGTSASVDELVCQRTGF
jgi:hypothetical protein